MTVVFHFVEAYMTGKTHRKIRKQMNISSHTAYLDM